MPPGLSRMSFPINPEQLYKMIFCYLISQDIAKFNKVKHLIFIFCQNNLTVVAYKDISMVSLPFHTNFIKNTQKFFFTINPWNFPGPDCTSYKCYREPKSPHPKSVLPSANALIGDISMLGNILSTVTLTVQAFIAWHMFYMLEV